MARSRPASDPVRALARLDRLRQRFADLPARETLALLALLGQARFAKPREIKRLHEALLALRAHAGDPRVRARAERLLERFAARPDLERHRDALADSGIAGTEIWFRFFEPTARWVIERWPDRVTIDWASFDHAERLATFLPLLGLHAESPAIDEIDRSPRAWIDAMRTSSETDAAFLVRRFTEILPDPFARERLWDELDVPLLIAPGPGGPARTTARDTSARAAAVITPPGRGRPDLRDAIRETPRVRAVSPREGRRYVDLARESMITRARDLDAFSWADPRDVRMVEFGDGLAFALMGQNPERRLMFESVYGALTIRSGVPIGYVLTASLFGSAEVAYNVFETFRDADAAAVYGRVLAMTRHVFGADTFMVPPYQLGDGNDEAIASGAWWFYRKLGFRPRAAEARRIERRELARMARRPGHRSSAATLATLATHPLYWSAGLRRADVMGRLPLGALGLAATRLLAKRFGSARDAGERTLADEALHRAGAGSMSGWTAGERLAWRRWSPLLVQLPGLERWTAAERRALVRVVRAKGGRRESDYVRQFDAHPKLRRALLALGG
jgi:hypothetical protein